jgi:hypothetical protein
LQAANIPRIHSASERDLFQITCQNNISHMDQSHSLCVL